MYTKVLIIILLNICLTYGKTDKTLEKKATGNDVVDAVIQKIKDLGVFHDDNGIMRRIAYVESKFGIDPDTFTTDGGIWRIDAGAFTEITKHSNRYQRLNTYLLPSISNKLGIDIKKT